MSKLQRKTARQLELFPCQKNLHTAEIKPRIQQSITLLCLVKLESGTSNAAITGKDLLPFREM